MSKWMGSWRIGMVVLAVAAVMLPTGAATAAQQSPVPPPEPQPFTDCFLQCASPAVIRTTTPHLAVLLPGPAGSQPRAFYEVRTVASRAGTLVAIGLSEPVTAPAVASWQVPAGELSDGSTYYWRAVALDEHHRPSDWTSWQQLRVDTARPDLPTVSSVQYPEQEWGAVLGTEGTFDFASASPDVMEFRWSVNSGSVTTTPATGSGPRTASVTFTPTRDLVNVLTVEAVDAAGWRSGVRSYQFFVTPLPNTFAHWTLDELDGTTAADSGTTSAPGTLSGEVSFGPGYVGGSNGAVFTGAGGQVATDGPVLDTTRDFTVMAWVNLSDATLGDQTVLSQDGTDASGFQLHFVAAANGGAGGWCFTMRTADSPGTAVTVCADGSIAGPPVPGQWVHVAATYESIADQIAVYVMGGENCIGETARTGFTNTWQATGPFAIGRALDSQHWRGGVDDVFAHARALPDVEICQQALQ